jgi:uncharacterized protein
MLAALAVGGVVIGACMGVTGIGGFLVVPMMIVMLDASPAQAVFTALVANLGVTIAGGVLAIGRRQVDWRTLRWLGLGSLIGALAAVWLLQALPPIAARVVIGAFLAATGVWTLLGRRGIDGRETPAAVARMGIPALTLTGAIAQVAAVLVGVGGPAVTVPVLLPRSRALHAVGTALVHGAVLSGLGLLMTRRAGAVLSLEALAVAAIVVGTAAVFAAFRGGLLVALDLRLVVGVLALAGSLFVLAMQ